MQLLTHAARMFLPWIGRLIMFMLNLIGVMVASFWGGVPKAVSAIADNWLDRAVMGGFPTQWDRNLYYVFWALAFGMILLGWIVLSYVTVWLVRLLF
jgi:hypothetical protein